MLDNQQVDGTSDNLSINELEDGSAIIENIDNNASSDNETDHNANIAETLDEYKLNSVAGELLDLIEKDKEARKQRDKQQEEGIRRTGLGDDAPGGAQFDGASRIVHPVLAEGCVDFSARAIKELFPVNGPVKTRIHGLKDEAAIEKAKRKRDFLNFYLTVRMPEYRSEKEILLTQLPLGGSQYEKYWPDPTKKRICMEFVPIDKVFLPYMASSFYDSPRITHEQERSEAYIASAVKSGFYRDIFDIVGNETEESASQKATNKIEGKDSSGYSEDGVRIIYEVTCVIPIEDDQPTPYVIHIDEFTGEIAAIYRNYDKDDELRAPLQWWVEDKFIPWRGAYGIGLHHLIGGMAGCLTGALRALLDSAHINNAPTSIKLKGGRSSGQNIDLGVTEVTEIDAPAGTDDIRKVIMPLPFNPPSQVLFQLLDWITVQAKGVVTTAEEKIADSNNNMPVGTTLALIEQGAQVFSSIHSRLHESQRRALGIICRLIRECEEWIADDLKRFGLTIDDFADNDNIEPVSDPNIFSEAQRFAQMQAVHQMSLGDAQDPTIPWDKIAVRRRMLELLRIDGADELLKKPDDPVTDDPVSENFAAFRGKQIKAHIQQNHMAHLKVHLLYITSPINMIDQSVDPSLAAILTHCKEHLVYMYQSVVGSGVQLAVQNPGHAQQLLAMQKHEEALAIQQQQMQQMQQQQMMAQQQQQQQQQIPQGVQ